MVLLTRNLQDFGQFEGLRVTKIIIIGGIVLNEERWAMVVSLEERVALLKAEVARLKALSQSPDVVEPRWWEKIAGTFADDPAYDEAMRLGREYRKSH